MIVHQKNILCTNQLPLHDCLSHWPFMAAGLRYSQPVANTSRKPGVGLQIQGSAPQRGKNKGFAQNCVYSLHLPQKKNSPASNGDYESVGESDFHISKQNKTLN